MSRPLQIVRARLIPKTRSRDGSNLIIEGENSYPIFNHTGLRLQCAFFEKDGSTIVDDVSSITSARHFVTQAASSFMTQTLTGPFANITRAQWDAGTHQHLEFLFSDLVTALAAGTDYTAHIVGDDSDGLAANDFACIRPMTVLSSGLDEALTPGDTEAIITAALAAQLTAQLGSKADKIGSPGHRIALTTAGFAPVGHPQAGKRGRIWLEAVMDADGNILLDQQSEYIS